MRWIIPGIIISYLIGSIPTAYIFGRLLKGIDIRKFGSGNVGATNAMRVLGKGPGILVLLLDALKGFLPVVFLGRGDVGASIIFGLACIFGHNWTLFLNFKGGKGMAATLGVLIGLSLQAGGLRIILALSIAVWLAVFLVLRIVSIASIISALALPVFSLYFKQSRVIILTSIILSFFVLLRHRSNIQRILQGKEKRLF
ncbi:MAG: glycerol-3-phosphate 1-O-acyltransferase PlsY [Candidatus Omnitrophota bacterium]